MYIGGLARASLYILALTFSCDPSMMAQKLHNERRDKLAQQIKSDFEQLTSPDTSIFEQAIKNVEATNDADIAQWRERQRTLIESIATTMPFLKWEELRKLVFEARKQALGLTVEEPMAGSRIESVATEIDANQKDQDVINTKLDELKNFDTEHPPNIKQIQDALEATLNDGTKLTLDPKALKDKAEALKDDFANLKDIISRLQPQGLNRLMLETTLLRLRNEQSRLELQKAYYEDRKKKLEEYAQHITAYVGNKDANPDCTSVHDNIQRLGAFGKVLDTICDTALAPQQEIIVELQNLAAQARTLDSNGASANQKLVDTLINLTRVLDLLGAARYDLLVEKTNLSQDELIFNIRKIQLNSQEHEVLLHAGITGLATYESGGVKPEDIANIIHMAQALATGAIAARIK